MSLDGTALAGATGLPLRYGSELLHCVKDFFQGHHVLPVVDGKSLLTVLGRPSEMSVFQRSLFLCVCAVAKLKRWCAGDFRDRTQKEFGCTLLERALHFRSSIDYMEEKSPMTVVASYLLRLAYACLNKPESSRLFMQEAICRALDLRLHITPADDSQEIDTILAQRTLALLFVTGRSNVILNDSTAMLVREPPFLPTISFSQPDRLQMDGFKCLFSLFALLDSEVVVYWCSGKLKSDDQKVSQYNKLHGMQNQLSTFHIHDTQLSDEAMADVLVTQEWLRLICWQISMRLGCLSNQATRSCFSYDYPIDIASKTCKVLRRVPESAVRVHHFSIYSKLFEIAYSLMDILTLAGRPASSNGCHELKTLFRYLSTSPITNMRFARVLMEKEHGNSNATSWPDGDAS